MAVDVTEKRELETVKQRFNQIIVDSVNEIFLFEPDSLKFVQVNNSAIQNLGYSIEEMREMTPIDIKPNMTLESFEDLIAPLRSGAKEGIVFETHHQRKDQSICDVEIRLQIIGNKPDHLFCAIIVDVTDKKQMQKRLLQSQKMEAVGTLAGGIAHDFNNILASILGYTEMALDELPQNGEIAEDLKIVFDSGIRAKELVGQILTIARQGEEKALDIKLQPILKETLKFTRSSFPSNIEIRQEVDPECRRVYANPTQIHQIMMNLITNARHAMGEENGILDISIKEVEVDNKEHPDLKQGDYVCLTVADSGVGMNQSTLDRIFEPYFTTKDKDTGTGLGLAVCHGIIMALNGSIEVTSEIGKGTVFQVFLPVALSQHKFKPETQLGPDPTGNEHILLVDDEPSLLKMMKKILERLGYKVTTRANGLEAWDCFRSDPDTFNLMITDVTMPQMTGDQLSMKILEMSPSFPIILCSGFSGKISESEAEAMGIRALMKKPIAKRELARKIRETLDEVY